MNVDSILKAPSHDLVAYVTDLPPAAPKLRFPGLSSLHAIKTVGPALATFEAGAIAQARSFAVAASDGDAGAKAIVSTSEGLSVFDTADFVTSKYWDETSVPDAGFGSTNLSPVMIPSFPKQVHDVDFADFDLVALVDGTDSYEGS